MARAPTTVSTMHDLHTLLVPVDFSPCSERALQVAAALSVGLGALGEDGLAQGATLHLLHVYPIEAYAAPPMLPAPVLVGPFRKQSEQAFQGRVDRWQAELHRRLEATFVEGIPHQQIVEQARLLHADLIVIGTHGRTGFTHALMGSVAERVLRTAHCPVLTVPPDPTS